MIHGGNATIYVSDMDRAVGFYTNTLGLKLQFRAGNHWAQVDAGNGLQIGLHPTGPHSPPAGKSGSISVGFSISKPLDQVVNTLQSRGVAFRGPIVDDAKGGIRLAFFGDPDGNDLYLVEVKQQAKWS